MKKKLYAIDERKTGKSFCIFEITFTLDDKQRQMDCKQISIIFRVKTNVVMMFSSLLLIHSEIKLLLILYHTKTDTPIK